MSKPVQQHMISSEITSFIVDRRTRNLSQNTIDYYSYQLKILEKWGDQNGVSTIEDLTADAIRKHLLWLADHRNAGGVHASWRAIKVFLRWFEVEVEPVGWKNPMHKVAAPKINDDPLPGISEAHLGALMSVCGKDQLGLRDRAMFAALYDSGIRQQECSDLLVGDLDLQSGRLHIRHGKGNKSRFVFLGAKARKEITRYLRSRGQIKPSDPLFATRSGTKFSTDGMRQMLVNRSKEAGLPKAPGFHAFRRGFAAAMLKRGSDILTISRILGHSTTSLVARYARQTPEDLQDKHDQFGPLDNL